MERRKERRESECRKRVPVERTMRKKESAGWFVRFV